VVAASDEHFNRLASSNYGNSVDLLVYGGLVRAPSTRGDYVRFSGTSLAAAITSGLAALLLSQQADLSLVQLEDKLKLLTQPTSTKIY